MDIFLSINNRQEVLQLPVVPTTFMVSGPMKNNEFETIGQGDLNLIGLRGLRTISLSSFFPSKRYSFSTNNVRIGYQYVTLIESWMQRRLPIRLVITSTSINWAVSIEKFDYGKNDRTGDIYYTLDLKFFPMVQV